MITDPAVQKNIAQQWSAMRVLCRSSHRQAIVAPGVFINETPPDEFYNLSFILAYAVLDPILDALIDQGVFTISKIFQKKRLIPLGKKMNASRKYLPWVDYSQIEIGKNASNDLRHRAKVLAKSDCLLFIDKLEAELKAWNVIS
jgi:hypothetical protein